MGSFFVFFVHLQFFRRRLTVRFANRFAEKR
jgi:hypothetical protein